MEKSHELFRWALVIVAIILAAPKADAHEWYPMECCSGLDCAPAESTAYVVLTGEVLPHLVVTTKMGTVVIPHNTKWRDSKDNRMHVCMRPNGDGTMQLLCIFAPPGL